MNIEGVEYGCVERFYQVKRAKLCGENDLAASLMVQDSGRDVKTMVTEFQYKYPNKLGLDDKDKEEVMMTVLRAKFSYPELKLSSTQKKKSN